MSTKEAYARMQRAYYNRHAQSIDDARHLVHPDFALAARQAVATQAHVVLDYLQRTYLPTGDTVPDVLRGVATMPAGRVRALDFGCGVGRLMVPLVEAGVEVDGVDISERMLAFAQEDARLHACRFFTSGGTDLGGAPDGAYDLVYSSLVLQHVCSRTIRRELLAAFARALKPGGVVVLQLHFYPHYDSASVPAPHRPWHDDGYDAAGTNSEADVWVTPDALPLVHADVSAHFKDVRFQFVDFPRPESLHSEAYGTWFGHMIVSGSRGASLASRLYADPHPGA